MWENLFWANNNLRPCKVRILICLIIQNVVFAQWESLLILMFIFPSFLIVDFRISVKFLSFFVVLFVCWRNVLCLHFLMYLNVHMNGVYVSPHWLNQINYKSILITSILFVFISQKCINIVESKSTWILQGICHLVSSYL